MNATQPDVAAVLTERRDGVLVITLNRPEVRNAINAALAHGIAAALDELDRDEGLSVGVITGAGGFFCAGMDLQAFVDGESSFVDGRGFAGIAERASQKPLIAAIERFAIAGGLEVALCCDLVVASREAKFAIPEVRRSLIAVGGALLKLPRRMPYHVVMEMALLGDTVTAQQLHTFGLVNRLVDTGDALSTALELAAAMADNGPLALVATKRILQEQTGWDPADSWIRQAEIAEPVLASADAQEGARAFKERRSPVWRGV